MWIRSRAWKWMELLGFYLLLLEHRPQSAIRRNNPIIKFWEVYFINYLSDWACILALYFSFDCIENTHKRRTWLFVALSEIRASWPIDHWKRLYAPSFTRWCSYWASTIIFFKKNLEWSRRMKIIVIFWIKITI
jgi:hypothetical protein